VVIGLGIGGLLAYHTYRLVFGLLQAKTQNQTLVQATRELQHRLQALQDEYATLQAANQNLTVDRDNLITQAQQAFKDKDQAVASQDVLKRILKKTVEENRALVSRLTPLETEFENLRRDSDKLANERDLLQQRLEEAERRSRKKELHAELDTQRKKNRELAKAVQEAQQQIREFERKQNALHTKSAQLQIRLDTLQDKYTKLLSENTTLRQQAKKTPTDVTKLAQQHQRLIKETADMHYNLGVLFTRSKQYDRAAVEFRKVIELKPEDAGAYYNLGIIYAEHLPNRDKAMEHFRRYLQLSPRARDASWVKQYIASWQAWEGKERLE